ncbi:MAG: Dyp-type peroxidase, partial [Gemmatimonadetes bacterium]|nr:Dyp-type peroxidase [Gemmatimonadota bacterium]NIT67893.1 Dyp-type peroxidase [Gemmatimonadota bacterium]NIY36470.1 Dyp-type peroxidase [Gemmatimonadota bacterium]
MGPGFDVPSTQAALWCWIRGDDRGDIMHAGRHLQHAVAEAFETDDVIDAFRHREGLDLTGYEDGTENPEGEDAAAAALVAGAGPGADDASFVAVQQWVHDFEVFEAKPVADRDDIIGRRLSDNEELADAPPSAHVKRTAQESFTPEAFILRRSMPWADEYAAGLQFVAFGKSFDAFEAQLRRMVGAEDGIADALFTFTRPVTGAYFWCPPMKDGRPDLGRLGM